MVWDYLSASCHLDRALNVEIGVECQIFVIVDFFKCGQELGADSRYYKGASTLHKEIIFSYLYLYFQIWFSSRLKKSTQIFNTRFVIRRSVQMKWSRLIKNELALNVLNFYIGAIQKLGGQDFDHFWLPTNLDVDIFYPKRGQKEAFFDHLPTSSFPRSFWMTPL